MKAGHNQTEIAGFIDAHKSTICRNQGLRGYRPRHAHRFAMNQRQCKVRPRIGDKTWMWVEALLREDWSLEQVSLWLKNERGVHISHEWIYQYVLNDKLSGGDLYRHLRCQKQRRKRYGAYSRRGQLINRISIDERPAVVQARCRIGDW